MGLRYRGEVAWRPNGRLSVISWNRKEYQSICETDHCTYFVGEENHQKTILWSWFVIANGGARIGWGTAPDRDSGEKACMDVMSAWLEAESGALALLRMSDE
jgi:hypothetical protein